MSNGLIVVVVVAFWGGVIYLAARLLGTIFSSPAVTSITAGVAEKTKNVAAKAGHSLELLALRASTVKQIKMGLEVSDQHTGANELGLDSSLTKKNEMLAQNIAERAFKRFDYQLDGQLPSASLLGAHALYEVASQVGERVLREKTRIAGGALMLLVRSEGGGDLTSLGLPPLSRQILHEIASMVARLDTQDFAHAFETGGQETGASRAP